MDYHTDLTLSHVEQMAAQAQLMNGQLYQQGGSILPECRPLLMNGQPQFSNQAIADVINTISEAIAYEHIHSGSEQVLGILDRALTMARGLLHD